MKQLSHQNPLFQNCYCLTLLFSFLAQVHHPKLHFVTLGVASPAPAPAPTPLPPPPGAGVAGQSVPAGVPPGSNQQTSPATSGNYSATNIQLANAIATAAATVSSNGPNANNQAAYVLQFLHHDLNKGLAFVNMVPMNYTNKHEPRIELRYQSRFPYVSIDERTPNNTVVSAIVVNDDDNDSTNLAIEQGNELGHFALVSTQYTNTIQVSGAPLSSSLVPQYNLTIVARDNGVPPKMSSVNLVIKVTPSMQPHPPLGELSNKPPVADLMNVAAGLVVFFSILVFLIILGCALCQRPKSKKGGPGSGVGGVAGGPVGSGPPPPRAMNAGSDSRIHHSSDPFLGLDLSHYRPPPNHHYIPK